MSLSLFSQVPRFLLWKCWQALNTDSRKPCLGYFLALRSLVEFQFLSIFLFLSILLYLPFFLSLSLSLCLCPHYTSLSLPLSPFSVPSILLPSHSLTLLFFFLFPYFLSFDEFQTLEAEGANNQFLKRKLRKKKFTTF